MVKYFEYLLVVLSIIVSNSLFYTTYNDDAILMVLLLTCVLAYFINRQGKINRYYFIYGLICSLFMLAHPVMLGNMSIINTYLGYIIRVLSFVLIISLLGYYKYSRIYVKIMIFICSVNLILYVDQLFLFGLSDPIASLFRLAKTFDENVFYENFVFYFKPIRGTWGYYSTFSLKNSGIFGEGGVYQYFVNVALIINIFFHRQTRLFSFANMVFIISVLTTFSTAGYLSLGLILAFIGIEMSFKRNIFRVLAIISPLIAYLLFSTVVYDKLFNEDSMAFKISTTRRMLDTEVDLNVIKDFPFMGIGIGNNELWQQYSNERGGGSSSSNGIMNYMAKFGLIGFIITLYPFFRFNIRRKRNVLLFLASGISMLSQGLIMTPIFLLSMSLIKQKEN
jgi:hypothetical protein